MKLEKGIIIVLLGISLAVLVPVSIGAYMIYSNIVTVNVVEYSLSLSPMDQTVVKYHYANVTALLTLNGAPQQGKTVSLLFANGTSTGISAVTNSTGHAFMQWNATGPASFKCSYPS